MIWSAQSAISVSFYSSIAQSVEHAAVNRAVVGSSPTRGVLVEVHGDHYLIQAPWSSG